MRWTTNEDPLKAEKQAALWAEEAKEQIPVRGKAGRGYV
jgi:hypothetical protein